MNIIAILLTTLAIFSPILSSQLEPRRWGHMIANGVLTSEYVEGFVGERPWTGPDGDYVRATFCYCKTAYNSGQNRLTRRQKQWDQGKGNKEGEHSGGGNGIRPGEILRGHFWRYEYYNYHNNATYWLNHYCMEDAFPKDKHGCGYDAPGQFMPTPDTYFSTAGTKNDWSFVYSPIPNHKHHTWTVNKRQFDVDWIMYGRGVLGGNQKRRLGTNQGLIEMPKEYVDEKCNHYCDTELLLPMDHSVKSHGELYNDVDDMCDRCA